MKNEQNSTVNMGSFMYMMDAAIAFVLVVCFRWNFFIAACLSALVGEGFIRPVLIRKTSDEKNVPKLIAIANRGWWAIAGLSIALVLFVLMSTRSTSDDYFWGIVIIVITLAKAGWIDWNHSRKLRAVMLFLSCINWLLLGIPRNDITSAMAFFAALGFAVIAFLWSFVDALFLQKKSNDSIQATLQVDHNFKTRPLLIAVGVSLVMQLTAMCIDNTFGLYETILMASLCLSQSVHVLAGCLYSFLSASEGSLSVRAGAVGGAATGALARLIFSPITFLMILGVPYTWDRTIDELYPGLTSIGIAIVGLVGIAVVVLTSAALGAVGGAVTAAITRRKTATQSSLTYPKITP